MFHRLKVSPVLGFLLTGIVIGPSVLGQFVRDLPLLSYVVVTDREEISHLAELGVVFLLFMIGLELSLPRLLTMRRLVFGLGALQVVVSTAAVAGIAMAMGRPPSAALVIGAAVSLSSTAIVVELLSSQRRLSSQAGRASFSVLLFQDLAVVPILMLVGVLSMRQSGNVWENIGLALAQALAAIAIIIVVGRFVLRPLLRSVAATRSPDLFLAATLLIAVGTGLATNLAGLSMALGAFIAGLLLAETEYRRQVETLIEPFKGLLLGAFFLLVGMNISLAEVATHAVTIFGLALGLVLIKAATIIPMAMAFGVDRDAAVESGLLLGPGGEFAFVILGAATSAGVVAPSSAATAAIVVSVTMAFLPLLSVLARDLAARVRTPPKLPDEAQVAPPSDHTPRVIVAGYGRVGRLVGSMLEEHEIPYLAIDLDPWEVARQRRAGLPVYYGEASNPQFLRNCGIEEATSLVVTLDQQHKVDEVVKAARALSPNVKIIARARDDQHAQTLYAIGITEAVPETTEASLQLAEAVLVEAGIAMGLAIASVHERRDIYRKRLGRPDRRRLVAAAKAKVAPPT